MEYSNKELNEIRETGYNHGYSVGYNESTYNIESEVSKFLNESLEESAKNSNMAAAGYDEGWYAGEMNAYEKVFNFIEKLKEKDLEVSKRVIGYDDFGKPLHERDFCTFDVNATDWKFKPDNIRESGLATLEGQVMYNEQDKCFELLIDNDYCPALYFHAIEPGTLRVQESKEQIKMLESVENDKDIVCYDEAGKPLHEGDYCTFDVDVTDWEFEPDNTRKVKTYNDFKTVATMKGQIVYDDEDECYLLSIDNEYCPALYFRAIEPGTLRVKESNEQVKEHPLKRANKEIER